MLAARLMGFQTLFGLLSGGADRDLRRLGGAGAGARRCRRIRSRSARRSSPWSACRRCRPLSMIVYPMLAQAIGLDRAPGRHLPRRHHPRRGAGGRRRLRHVAADRRRRHLRQADAGGDARAGDRVRGDARSRPLQRRGRRPAAPGKAAAAAAVVRGRASRCWSRSTAPAGCRVAVAKGGSEISRWCLVAAIAGIGMKTQLKELAAVGLKPVRADARRDPVPRRLLVLALMRWAI